MLLYFGMTVLIYILGLLSVIIEFSELIPVSKVIHVLNYWQNQTLGHSSGCENTLHATGCIIIDNID